MSRLIVAKEANNKTQIEINEKLRKAIYDKEKKSKKREETERKNWLAK